MMPLIKRHTYGLGSTKKKTLLTKLQDSPAMMHESLTSATHCLSLMTRDLAISFIFSSSARHVIANPFCMHLNNKT